jgi:hypothetical protein
MGRSIACPRRFGKSLLISTLKELFEGNRELFKGLWIYDSDYRWTEHPVIRIDFGLSGVKAAYLFFPFPPGWGIILTAYHPHSTLWENAPEAVREAWEDKRDEV